MAIFKAFNFQRQTAKQAYASVYVRLCLCVCVNALCHIFIGIICELFQTTTFMTNKNLDRKERYPPIKCHVCASTHIISQAKNTQYCLLFLCKIYANRLCAPVSGSNLCISFGVSISKWSGRHCIRQLWFASVMLFCRGNCKLQWQTDRN